MCFEIIIFYLFRYFNWICYICEFFFVYYLLFFGIFVMLLWKYLFEFFVVIVLMIKLFWMDMVVWFILMSIGIGIWDYSVFNLEFIIGFVGWNCSLFLVMWGIYLRLWWLCCLLIWLFDVLMFDLFLIFLEF